jgi:hypothetical protein
MALVDQAIVIYPDWAATYSAKFVAGGWGFQFRYPRKSVSFDLDTFDERFQTKPNSSS